MGANNAYQDQFRYKPQISGSFSYFVDNFGPGNHNFKLGFEWLRDRKEFLSFQPGDVFYRDSSWRVPSSPSAADITTAEVDIWNTPNNSVNDSVQTSAFLNDTWAINSRLSVNLALRFDRYALGWPDQTATPNQSRDLPAHHRKCRDPRDPAKPLAPRRLRLGHHRQGQDRLQGLLRQVRLQPEC